MSETKFDGEGYCGSLDIILKAAQDEYKQIVIDRSVIQKGILKTYLWLATAMFSGQCALYTNMLGDTKLLFWQLHLHVAFFVCATASLVLSVGCFAFGVDTMRGRGVIKRPYTKSYLEIMNTAYQSADEGEYQTAYKVGMVFDLNDTINHQIKISQTIGKKLRLLSYSLLASLAITILAVIVSAFTFTG